MIGVQLKKHLTSKTELIVALDFPRADRAMELVKKLGLASVLFKVGSELFLSGGPDFVRELVHQKKRVFLDLKLHDIPNTVAKAARQAAMLHVEMMTVHLAGGSAMIRAVADELSSIPELKPKILGVSVLTSFDDVRCAEVTKAMTGHAIDVKTSVAGLVSYAQNCGVDGIVCSPLEVAQVRKDFPALYTVVPGIRPEGTPSNDQARVMTPKEARSAGAHAVVVGRPISEAKDPSAVVEKILGDLA